LFYSQPSGAGAAKRGGCPIRHVCQRGDGPHLDGQIPGRTEDHWHPQERSEGAGTDGQFEESAQVEQLRDWFFGGDSAPQSGDLQGVSFGQGYFDHIITSLPFSELWPPISS